MVTISHGRTWKDLPVQLVEHGSGDIDVAVLAPNQQVSPSYTVHTNLDGLVFGQDVFFLGLRYGLASELGELNDDFPLPFKKKSIVSELDYSEGGRIFYLDGHSNPGFSGGPVVYPRRSDGDMAVIGLVSGYIYRPEPVYDARKDPVLNYHYNTGIMKA